MNCEKLLAALFPWVGFFSSVQSIFHYHFAVFHYCQLHRRARRKRLFDKLHCFHLQFTSVVIRLQCCSTRRCGRYVYSICSLLQRNHKLVCLCKWDTNTEKFIYYPFIWNCILWLSSASFFSCFTHNKPCIYALLTRKTEDIYSGAVFRILCRLLLLLLIHSCHFSTGIRIFAGTHTSFGMI